MSPYRMRLRRKPSPTPASHHKHQCPTCGHGDLVYEGGDPNNPNWCSPRWRIFGLRWVWRVVPKIVRCRLYETGQTMWESHYHYRCEKCKSTWLGSPGVFCDERHLLLLNSKGLAVGLYFFQGPDAGVDHEHG